MVRNLAFMIVAATFAIAAQPARSQPPAAKLTVVDTFRIGGAVKWDYPIVDPESQRLYIACDNHVQVIDTKNGARIGDITGLQGAHGIAIVSDKKLGFITSGRENAVAVFDLHSLRVTRKIKMTKAGGRNPDAIIYDRASQKIFAFCAGGDAIAIDPANLDAKPIAITCGGKLEYGRSDGAGKLFVNNEDKSEIDVIDTAALKLVGRWSLAPLETPSGLAVELKRHRLFSVGENQKMAILDSANGKLIATVSIGEGSDGCAFDPKLRVVVSSNGDNGTATVVAETSPGKFAAVQTLVTAKSGRTIVNDPTTSRFYIPAMLPAEGGKPQQFGVLVLGPAK